MGQQLTKESKEGANNQSSSKGGSRTPHLKCKTTFHYIHPLRCQIDEQMHLEESILPGQDFKYKPFQSMQHEAEYWQIENNHDETGIRSSKDLEKIQEIKVKWNEFIKMKKKNYLEDYAVIRQIGRGGFGCVHKVKARYTGIYRAAKRIKKSQLKKSQHEKLFEEMAIMMSLDHPNIAKLYEVYDYKSYYVLILELCEGGQLFKKIVTKQMNQEFSGRVMKQILWTLIYLHKKGIVHRDLKPENMLFQQDSDTLKLIDFGIAVKKKPDEMLTQRLGTPYYIAPQVLCKNYDEKCDIWSAGVILFMMISGYPPFKGDNECQVMQNVLAQSIQFKGQLWHKTSTECKNLVAWMLKKNPQQRPSAQEAYGHPWIKRFVEKTKSTKQQNVLANIRGFSFQNKFKAVVYTYVVSQLLSTEEKKLLYETFKQLDKNNDGVIQTNQLYEALKGRKDVSQERVSFLMRIIDTNGSGLIDYTEFLVAGIDPKNALNECHFQQAFQYFDIDHSGAITFEQIVHFLQNSKESEESIKKIFKQVDQNNDGHISKDQFVKLLMTETKKKIRSYRSFRSDSELSASNNPQSISKFGQKSQKQQKSNQIKKKTLSNKPTVPCENKLPELKQKKSYQKQSGSGNQQKVLTQKSNHQTISTQNSEKDKKSEGKSSKVKNDKDNKEKKRVVILK